MTNSERRVSYLKGMAAPQEDVFKEFKRTTRGTFYSDFRFPTLNGKAEFIFHHYKPRRKMRTPLIPWCSSPAG